MSTHTSHRPPGSNAIRLRGRDDSAPSSPPPWRDSRARWLPLSIGLGLALLVLVAVGSYLYDNGRRDLIAPGVRVAGVNIGGLRLDAARQRLRSQVAADLARRAVTVQAAGRRFSLTAAAAHAKVAIDALTQEALDRSRRGSIISRVVHGLDGQALNLDLPAQVTYSHAAVRHLVDRIGAATQRPARNATVVPSATGLQSVAERDGVAVDTGLLARRIERALVDPNRPHVIVPPMHPVRPAVTTSQLASRYPAYIIIDRGAFRLRLYEHLRPASTYTIAVGRQGLETPAGLYDIQWKEVNPSWHVPNSAWAGPLAGQTIPPGPQDPIKARWMAFNGGAGIHGTDNVGSLGTAASHGCIRMGIADVIALYSRVPVGTPVYVA